MVVCQRLGNLDEMDKFIERKTLPKLARKK